MDKQIIQNVTQVERIRITRENYEAIIQSIQSWPQWKKNLFNEELIISVKAKKI